jgi:hypothetical protein
MKDQVGKVVNAELMGRVSISRKTTSVSCIGIHGVARPIWLALYISHIALLYSSYRMLYELAGLRLVLPVSHRLSAIGSSILVFESQLIP